MGTEKNSVFPAPVGSGMTRDRSFHETKWQQKLDFEKRARKDVETKLVEVEKELVALRQNKKLEAAHEAKRHQRDEDQQRKRIEKELREELKEARSRLETSERLRTEELTRLQQVSSKWKVAHETLMKEKQALSAALEHDQLERESKERTWKCEIEQLQDELQRARQLCSEREDITLRLQDSLHMSHEETRAVREELHRIRDQNMELEERVAQQLTTQRELHAHSSRVDELTEELQRRQAHLNDLHRTMELHRNRADTLEQDVSTKLVRIQELENRIFQKDHEINLAQRERNTARVELETLRTKEAAMLGKLQALQSEVADRRRDMSDQAEQLEAARSEHHAASHRLHQVEEELSTLRFVMTRTEDELDGVSAEHQRLKEVHRVTERELEQYRTQERQRGMDFQQLQDAYSGTQKELAEVREACREASARLDANRHDAERCIHQLEEELTHLVQARDSAENNLHLLATERTQWHERYQQVRIECAALQEQSTKVTRDLEQAHHTLSRNEKIMETMRHEHAETLQLHEMSQKTQAGEIAALRDEIGELHRRLNSEHTRVEADGKRCSSLEVENGTLRLELSQLKMTSQRQADMQEEKVKELADRNAILLHDLEDAQRNLTAENHRVSCLTNTNQTLSAHLESIRQRCTVEQEVTDTLRQELCTKHLEMERLQQVLTQVKAELQTMETAHQALQSDRHELSQTLEQTQTQVQELTTRAQSLQEQVDHLTSANDALHSEVDATCTALAKTTEHSCALESQVLTLTKDLESAQGHSELHVQEVRKLQESLDQSTKWNGEQQRALERIRCELSANNDAREELKLQVAQLTKELSNAQAQHAELEVLLRTEREEHAVQWKESAAANNTLQAAMRTLQEELEQHAIIKASLERKLVAYEIELEEKDDELHEQQTELIAQLQAIRIDRDEQTSHAQCLASELMEQSQRLTTKMDELSTLQTNLAGLQRDLSGHLVENTYLKESAAALQRKLEVAMNELDDIRRRHVAVEAERDHMTTRFREAQKDLESLQDRLKQERIHGAREPQQPLSQDADCVPGGPITSNPIQQQNGEASQHENHTEELVKRSEEKEILSGKYTRLKDEYRKLDAQYRELREIYRKERAAFETTCESYAKALDDQKDFTRKAERKYERIVHQIKSSGTAATFKVEAMEYIRSLHTMCVERSEEVCQLRAALAKLYSLTDFGSQRVLPREERVSCSTIHRTAVKRSRSAPSLPSVVIDAEEDVPRSKQHKISASDEVFM